MYATREKPPAKSRNQSGAPAQQERIGSDKDYVGVGSKDQTMSGTTTEVGDGVNTEHFNKVLALVRQRELQMRRKMQNAKNEGQDDEEPTAEIMVSKYGEKNSISNNQSILSPHESIYEALNNPDLNRGIDMAHIEASLSHSRGVSQCQAQFPFPLPNNNHSSQEDNDLNFSVTSWQNISSHFGEWEGNTKEREKDITTTEGRSDSGPLRSFRMLNNNSSNIISSAGNDSPPARHVDFFGNTDSPGRVDSPNIASSILSTSSDCDVERQELDQFSGQTQGIVDENGGNITRNKTFIEKVFSTGGYNYFGTKNDNVNKSLDQQPSILFGEDESPSSQSGLDSDTEVDHTVDSSTVISSFVMPRMSLSGTNSFTQLSNDSQSKRLTVKIIGDLNGVLLKRFKSYGKLLKNINFVDENTESFDLILLVVSKNNFNIPKVCKSLCIPITINREGLRTFQKIPKSLRICSPINLESLEDDLINLVNFLNSVKSTMVWKTFFSNLKRSNYLHQQPLTNLTSKLIQISSSNNSINLASSYVLGLNEEDERKELFYDLDLDNYDVADLTASNGNIPMDKGDDDAFSNDDYTIRNYLIAGVAFGIATVGIILYWRRFQPKHLNEYTPIIDNMAVASPVGENSIQQPHPSKNSIFSIFDFTYGLVQQAVDGIKIYKDKIIIETFNILEDARQGLLTIINF